jgi:aconitate hydratase 2/2-methylisocitrate dehydratase
VGGDGLDLEDCDGSTEEHHPHHAPHVIHRGTHHYRSGHFLESYKQHVKERASLANGIGIPPKPLVAAQVRDLIHEIHNHSEESTYLVDLLANCVPPGVDEASYVKAGFLSAVATKKEHCDALSREYAIELLGTMQGGYNVHTLVDLLKDLDEKIANLAADQLKHTLLVFDAFYDVEALHKQGFQVATSVLTSWASAEWFLKKPEIPKIITATVFKVTGETNTDDLSPAQDAWSRPDIPLHALSMLKNPREGIEPLVEGEIGPLAQMQKLKEQGFPLAYVGDVVGTGSSRKSATNSVLWYMGNGIPNVPNIKSGGLCMGGKIAPIFFSKFFLSLHLPST